MEQRSYSLNNIGESQQSQLGYEDLKLIRNVFSCFPKNTINNSKNNSLSDREVDDINEYNNHNIVYFSNIPVKAINRQQKQNKIHQENPPIQLNKQQYSFRRKNIPQPSIIYHNYLDKNFTQVTQQSGDRYQPQFEDEEVEEQQSPQKEESKANNKQSDKEKSQPKTDSSLKTQARSSSELSVHQRKNYYFQADKNEQGEKSKEDISEHKKKRLRQKKEQKKQKRQKIIGKPYDVIFKWSQFFETFIPYLLFGFILGPLASFIVYFRTGSFHLANNMGLYVRKPFSLLSLYFSYVVITILVFLKLSKTEKIMLYYSEFIFINFLMYLMLSIKYGYMHSLKYQKYKTSYLKLMQLGEDYLRQSWKNQDPLMIEKELQDSISRNEVETSSFYIEFMCQPSQEIMKKLVPTEIKNRKIKILNFERKQDNFIDCYKVLLHYINYYNTKYTQNATTCKSIIIVIIRVLYCLSMKFLPLLQGKDNQNVYAFICFTLMVLIESYCIFFFIEIAYILLNDLKRKEFLLIQLSYLISPKKVEAINESNRKKLLPTLTMGCPISIRSWGQMRAIVLDYGKIFEQRSNFFLSSYLLIIEALALFLILNVFGIIKIDLSINLYDILITGFDFFLFFILTLRCFMTAAAINEQSEQHQGLIMSNKIIFTEISLNYKLYSNQNITFSSPVYSALIKSFRQVVRQIDINHMNFEEFTWYIQELYSNLIQELVIFQDYKPMKVINIVVSKNLVIQLLLSALSAIFALLWNQSIQPLLLQGF